MPAAADPSITALLVQANAKLDRLAVAVAVLSDKVAGGVPQADLQALKGQLEAIIDRLGTIPAIAPDGVPADA